ncbi:MAG TPA: NAD(P)H-binding protein [Flavisolibacter sp.]|nr:NAD(P)H-binding protein [Flavisolibacter sp.]
MRNKHIVVTGATGNLGSKVATALLENHQPIVVTGRNEEKLAAFTGKAKLLTGNLEDSRFLQELLQDAAAVFLVLPNLNQLSIKGFAEQLISIAEASGVTHVVNISNCTLTRFGKPTSLIEFETYLNEAEQLHIKHLRCANFFENLNWGIHTPYHPDIKLPYISSFEIARTAARYLQEQNFTGHTVDELMGVADYSMSEIATQLGVTYQQVPARAEDQAFFDAFNSGQYELVKRTLANTSVAQDERFTLSYFLEHDFNRELLK